MAPRINVNHSPILRGLYVYWRIIGLCPFVPVEGDETIRFSYVGIIYTVILNLGYLIAYIQAVINRMNFVLSRETSMTVVADFSGLSIEYLVVVSAWLGFAFRHKKLKRILKALKKIHETSKEIGMEQDFEKIVRTVTIHTVIVNLFWMILFCGDHVLLANCKAFKLAVWLPFNLPRIVTSNVVVIFVDGMLVVKRFFHLLNENIYDLSREVARRPCAIVKRNRSGSRNCGPESFGALGPLEIYGQVHSDLVALTKMIVDFFSLSMILALLVHFIQMASDLYLVCLLAKDSRYLSWREKCTFIILCSWFSLRLVQTVVLMAISDSTAYEANRAGSVLHAMLTSGHPKNYLNAAEILSFRLLQRRLHIDLYGLIEMKLSVIHGMIGMVGTYITIMMQLDTPDIEEKKIERAYEQPLGSVAESRDDTSTNDSYYPLQIVEY